MSIAHLFSSVRVLPILTITRAEDAVPLARALVEGGLPVLEVTLRTPASLEAIRRIVGEVEGAVVGAGTVLTPADMARAAEAGAAFAVSPGLTNNLSKSAMLPWLPGVATASEVMAALELGLDHLKLYPAENVGGTGSLDSLRGPFPSVRFCPTGGITEFTSREYLSRPNVFCIGGSWLAQQSDVQREDWDKIRLLALAMSSSAAAAAVSRPRSRSRTTSSLESSASLITHTVIASPSASFRPPK